MARSRRSSAGSAKKEQPPPSGSDEVIPEADEPGMQPETERRSLEDPAQDMMQDDGDEDDDQDHGQDQEDEMEEVGVERRRQEDDEKEEAQADAQERQEEQQAEEEAGPKSRLIIEKLELINFKSYAGKRVIGPFHKRFTSIVGPNGSGKSNVIDAMLFVFGKRASKIRLKKVSELVHNSENYKNCDKAEVAVHFAEIIDDESDNDRYSVVEGSRLVVSRTADKSSKSKYYLNGEVSSFTEVQTLLKQKGIDLDHNRFLILQGEVEQISLMKPKAVTEHETGILEYLEEIIGTKKYVKPINELAAKVEELNDSRLNRLQSVKLVQKEAESLEGAKLEAENYLRIECKLNAAKAKLYQTYIVASKDEIVAIEENTKALKEKQEYEKKKNEAAAVKLEDLGETLKTTAAEHKELSDEHTKCQKEFNLCERRNVEMTEALKHCVAKTKKLKAKLKREKTKLKQAEETVASCEEERPKLQKRQDKSLASKEQAEAKKNEIFESVRSKTEGLRLALESKQKELIPLRQQVNERQQRLKTLESELALYTAKVANASTEYDEAQQSIADLDNQFKTQTQAAEKFKELIGQREHRLGAASEELKRACLELGRTEMELKKHRSEAEEVKFSLSNARNRGSVHECLSKHHQEGSIPGFFGRLGDLGSIDSKYDVAISTACPQLNNMVVDCVETAQVCTRYLRKKNAGRTTFIILDKVKATAMRKNNNTSWPENAPRLFDLVQVDDARFEPAFFFALSNTLVANDLDQAVRIGYHSGRRHRVVSLKGDLIDPSGTMSGGGKRVARGGMAQAAVDASASPEDLKKVESSISRLMHASTALQDKRRSLEAEISVVQKELQQLRINLSKAEIDCKGVSKLKSEQEDSLKGLRDALTLSAEEKASVANLKKQIQTAKSDRDP